VGGDGQQPITLAEKDDAAGVFMFGELPRDQPIAQRPDFVAIQIAYGVTQLIGWGIRTRNQAMRCQALQHVLTICVHVDTFSLTFAALFSRASAKIRSTKNRNAHSSLDKENLWLMIRTWTATTTAC
jgi:hypothetical protein